MLCHGALPCNGVARDRCCGIAMDQLVGEPLGFLAAACIAEKSVDIHEARAGDDALEAHMTETSGEIAQQFNFEFGARGEVTVSTFAGEDVVALSIPIKTRF